MPPVLPSIVHLVVCETRRRASVLAPSGRLSPILVSPVGDPHPLLPGNTRFVLKPFRERFTFWCGKAHPLNVLRFGTRRNAHGVGTPFLNALLVCHVFARRPGTFESELCPSQKFLCGDVDSSFDRCMHAIDCKMNVEMRIEKVRITQNLLTIAKYTEVYVNGRIRTIFQIYVCFRILVVLPRGACWLRTPWNTRNIQQSRATVVVLVERLGALQCAG